MSTSTLHFKELEIYQMPGFPHGLPLLKELHPQVNIIAGPNASGKSSTARVLQQILNRTSSTPFHARAVLEINGDQWQLEHRYGRLTIQREGKEAELSLPGEELLRRHMLAFHELIGEDERDLARKIARDAIGGYDLRQAQEKLAYSSRIKSVGNHHKRYLQARKNLSNYQQDLRHLEEKRQSLDGLRAKMAQIRQAEQKQDFYQLVLEYRKLERELHGLEQAFQKYPSVLSELRPEDLKNVEDYEEEISSYQLQIDQSEQKQAELQRELAQLQLPSQGLAQEDLDEVELIQGELVNLNKDLQDIQGHLSAQEEKARRGLDRLDGAVDPQRWEQVDIPLLKDLEKFIQKAEHQSFQDRSWQGDLNRIEAELPSAPSAGEAHLETGIEQLSHWLQAAGDSKAVSWKNFTLLWGLGGGGVLLILFSLVFLPMLGTYLISAALIMGLLGFYLRTWQRVKSQHDRAAIYQNSYQQSELRQPDHWSPEAIRDLLAELMEELQVAIKRRQLLFRKEEVEGKIREAEPVRAAIKREFEAWQKQLQGLPELSDAESPSSYSGLWYFLINYKAWHEHEEERLSLQKRLEERQSQYQELFSRLQKLMVSLNYNAPQNLIEAQKVGQKMNRQAREWREAQNKWQEESSRCSDLSRELERLQKRKNQIYAKLQLEPDQKKELRRYHSWLDEYQRLREQFNFKRQAVHEQWEKLEGHSRFSEWETRLQALLEDEIEAEEKQLREQVDQKEAIQKDITAIETQMEEAKQRNDIEKALQEREAPLQELEKDYSANMASITGDILLSALRQSSREQFQPPVLKRASDLLRLITQGAYGLQVEDQDQSQFRAVDNATGMGLSLAELSTGSRVQLLLAVRLAFLQQQEEQGDYSFPLLADELLGNSDDLRAQAIIESLHTLSDAGRQIFYFTAQSDEVRKWRELAPAEKLQEIFLPGQEGGRLEVPEGIREESLTLQNPEVPDSLDPEGLNYLQSRQVPEFSLKTSWVGELALDYLTDNAEFLLECLKLRIGVWGKLENFLESGGELRHLPEGWREKAQEKVSLLEQYQKLYKQGRSSPLNPEKLNTEKAISENYLLRVKEKLEEYHRDPDRLIKGLRQKAVPGFRSHKIDELQESLVEQGYLPSEEGQALTHAEIIEKIRAKASRLVWVDIVELERFLKAVVGLGSPDE